MQKTKDLFLWLMPRLFQDPRLLIVLELLLVIALRLKVNFAVNLKLIIRHYLMLVANYLLVGFTNFDSAIAKVAISFTI